jgi:[citrate (pro-3S)-lyase] ligase
MNGYNQLITAEDFRKALGFLARYDLKLPEGIDYGLGYFEENILKGTAFLAKNIICGLCTEPHSQGLGVAAALISKIILIGADRGIGHFLLFTKPAQADKFGSLGFNLLAQTQMASLLELGQPDYLAWINQTRGLIQNFGQLPLASDSRSDKSRPAFGSVVMNANPFTLGHKHLVREGLKACQRLVVFVVQEEASCFPFDVRLKLVTQGLAEFPGVIVVPSGPYMVSRASFPAYFTDDLQLGIVQAKLDCQIFASKIAPDLNIKVRFLGEEPFSEVTNEYNLAASEIFPRMGLNFFIVPRLKERDEPISASAVRDLLRDNSCPDRRSKLSALVPETTLNYLMSANAKAVLETLQHSCGRH